MSKPVNLNRYRKEKARAEKRARADANAAKHGRTKADKAGDAARTEAEVRRLDGHKLDRDDDG